MDTLIIRETLKKALRQLNPSGAWPVNLHGILSRLGIELCFEEKGKKDSYLQLGSTPTIIIYRQAQGPILSARERFSIAHEIAHWIVWRRFGSFPSSETEYWWHETLCNEFAAGLLVPLATLQRFLTDQYSKNVNPAYFPEKVKRSAAVSWEVAAKSISVVPSEDSAYLRIVKIMRTSLRENPKTQRQGMFKVNCSTLTNMPGSYVGQSGFLRGEHELFTWIDELPLRALQYRSLSFTAGNLSLSNVPCSVLRETNYWVIHFSTSSQGVEISHKVTQEQ